MLIVSYLHVAEKYGMEETRRLFLFGQERSPEIYAVGQMNLLLHEITNANLANGDTLDYPRFRENGNLKQFDVVIANVPWNQDGYGEERLKKSDLRERFSFGFATQSSADWAWVQHMLASAKQNGRVGLVVDNGCLFRGGAEKTVRSKVVDKDLVECVILLPEKLFYNTGAPAAIIIFNSNKPADRKGKILFINASDEVIPHPSVRRLNSLSKENITRIVESYQKFGSAEGFSKPIDMKDIVDNDYNLNVTLYVMSIEKAEEIDLAKELSELKELEKERQETTNKLEKYVSDITQAIGEQK
jgi:type I restriction enzyme M protein